MKKIAIVVLHYETIEDTQKCLDSLQKYLNDECVQVVVVDNGSVKGKLDTLENSYKHPQIHFLYTGSNLGFARGNNVGYRYAKYQLGADMIVLANSDLVFEQEEFLQGLRAHYEKTNFDVAGPKIISLQDGKNQNPVKVQYGGKQDVLKRLIKYDILYLTSIFGLDTLLKSRFAKAIDEFEPKAGEDYQLHGACLILANDYIARYDGLYDETFMYGEENILKYITRHTHLKMCYFSDIFVYHKEGSSTQAIWGKGKAGRQFYYKWNIDSCRILLRLMHDDCLLEKHMKSLEN